MRNHTGGATTYLQLLPQGQREEQQGEEENEQEDGEQQGEELR